MSTCPALSASNALPAPSKHVSRNGTPRRLASSRASSGVMPPGFSGVPFASTMLPRLIEARSVPVGARSFKTSGETLILVVLISFLRRRDLRVRLVAALEAVGDEAAALHVFDEGPQIGCGRGPAFRRAHRLADFLEAAVHHAHVGMRPGVLDQRLAHARDRVELLGAEQLDVRTAAAGCGAHQ